MYSPGPGSADRDISETHPFELHIRCQPILSTMVTFFGSGMCALATARGSRGLSPSPDFTFASFQRPLRKIGIDGRKDPTIVNTNSRLQKSPPRWCVDLATMYSNYTVRPFHQTGSKHLPAPFLSHMCIYTLRSAGTGSCFRPTCQ